MNSKKYDLLCIGTAIVDVILKGFESQPVSPTGYRAGSTSLHVGGEAVNEAVTAAKLGLSTGILCALGRDDAGQMIEKALYAGGVHTENVLHSDQATPVTVMFVNPDGTRMSITNSSHRCNFHPERYADLCATAKAITLGSLFRAPFDDPEILHSVLARAKCEDTTVFADTKLPNFARLTLSDLRESLPLMDYILPNEDEAHYYTGKTDPEAMADVFLSYGVSHVIIKLGARGCLFKSANELIRLNAYPVKAIDATGAGDNFLAGLASALQFGLGHADALRFANACGALCASQVGATGGVKDRQQVENFMRTCSFYG